MNMFSQTFWHCNFISFRLFQACAPPTLFSKGRCYDMCPIQTYALNHTERTVELKTEETNQSIKLQDDEELQSIDRKKRSTSFYHNADEIGYNGPKTSVFPVENKITCEPCDSSCLQCFGPLNSQCSACPFGRQLKRMVRTNETYCINFSERSSGNALSSISTYSLYPNVSLTLIVSLSIAITLVIFFVVIKKRNNSSSSREKSINNSPTYAYDRVALFAEDDIEEEEVDVLKARSSAVEIDTDNNKLSEIIDN